MIYRTPADLRSEYPGLDPRVVIAASLLLLATHLAGIAIHTLARRRSITILDALQAMVASTLVACAFLWLAPGQSRTLMGVLSMAMAAACYWVIIGLLRHTPNRRNALILGSWGIALLLAGVFLLFSASAAGALLGVLAVSAVAGARRFGYPVLEIHGLLLIGAAVLASGSAQYAARCLVGPLPAPPDWAVLAASALAALIYGICAAGPGEGATSPAVRFVSALLATMMASALLIRATIGAVAALITVDSFHIAVLRTVALCGLALLLAFAGSRLRRAEMARMAYVMVAFVTAKLLFEDLRHGHLEFAAASICLVALTFILVPRIAGRSRSRDSATQDAN